MSPADGLSLKKEQSLCTKCTEIIPAVPQAALEGTHWAAVVLQTRARLLRKRNKALAEQNAELCCRDKASPNKDAK